MFKELLASELGQILGWHISADPKSKIDKQRGDRMTKMRLISNLVLVALLTACAPASADLSADEQIATIVAGTMVAQASQGTAATTEPIDGEVQVENNYGACANTGDISVAYVKDRNLYLWVEGGASMQLTASNDVTDADVSDDGCRIAYLREVPSPVYNPDAAEFAGAEFVSELWVLSSDGSANQKLAGLEFFATLPAPEQGTVYTLHRFGWQPGTHNVAYSTRLAYTGPGVASNNDIYLISANGGAANTLLPMAQGGDFYFSPDGQKVAFTTASSAGVVNVDGSGLMTDLITFPIVITYSEYLYYPPVAWTPDSNSFMVAVPPEEGLAEPVDGVYPETTLWYVPLDGTAPFEAGAVQTVWFVTDEVQFSPDAGRIAYVRQIGEVEAGEFELVTALSDGSNESPAVFANEIMFGDWAPDNMRYIYYITMGPNFQLYHGSVDSPNVTPISTLTAFQAASAIVDWVEGENFVLMVQGDAGSELSLMQTSGAGVMIDTSSSPFIAFDVAN
jgi:hypothetical protein